MKKSVADEFSDIFNTKESELKSNKNNQILKLKNSSVPDQKDTEFARANLEQFYRVKFNSRCQSIEGKDGYRIFTDSSIPPAMKVEINVNAQTVRMEREGKQIILPLEQFYKKLWSGSDPVADLKFFNDAQDQKYIEYCKSLEDIEEFLEPEPEPATMQDVEDVFADFGNEVKESTSDVDDNLFADVVAEPSKETTIEATESEPKKRGRKPKALDVQAPTTASTKSVLAVSNNSSFGVDVSDEIVIDEDEVFPSNKSTKLSDNNSTGEISDTKVSQRDIEGFSRVITAIITKLLNN